MKSIRALHLPNKLAVAIQVLGAVVIASVLFCGCVQMSSSTAIENYHKMLDPLVGYSSKQELEAKLGFPDRVNSLSGKELWHYFSLHSYYARDISNPSSGYNPVYDAVTLEFDSKGILRNWSVRVAR